ncbi:helix-turn-helix domain-containing protein [Chryseobacterium potabilaquae]|uniref:HTH-type transcriptional activator RhaR n=1 Tax=Chryseobacterium potabilaquae TaxID=2675057 RepID=A0A6N4XDK3_9FLAO|nr:AraC family transcriptional regulator [Chryseobacterium potabilaquae]CAA7196690.1 HTH-type transcriptional activator RhaR [Chryseobacterium potabilaquae]
MKVFKHLKFINIIPPINRFYLFFLLCLSYSQYIDKCNTIYIKTLLETSQKDLNKALEKINSLFIIANLSLLKPKSLMREITLYLWNERKYVHIATGFRNDTLYISLKNKRYKRCEKYLVLVKNINEWGRIKEKYRDVRYSRVDILKKIVNVSYAGMHNKNISLQKKSEILERKSRIYIMVLALFIMLIGILFFLRYLNNHKKRGTHLKKTLDLYSSRETYSSILEKKETSKLKKSELKISSVIEQKILTKLKEFEESDLFINNNMSRAYLATFCEINDKYLSYVINKHKNKGINSYINELRINYIIRKLRNVREYKKYKIAILAKESGFSSPNKFSLIFKKHIGMTPSQFIKELDK